MFTKYNCTSLLILARVISMATESSAQEGMMPMTLNITALNSGDIGQCPSDEERERELNKTDQQVRALLSEYQATEQPTTEQPTTEEQYTCDGTPGWRQVVFINMTDTSYNCPTGLNLTSFSKRTCGRGDNNAGCSSTTFSVEGSEYSQVCGRLKGYQYGATSAFWGHLNRGYTIDSAYADGVSLTHGPPGGRQHIWSFVAGLDEVDNGRWFYNKCPCDIADARVFSPPFVGNDYFCESAATVPWSGMNSNIFHPDDSLWDGQNCLSTSMCCQLNSPPRFTKTLPSATTDNIELRICAVNSATHEDTALEIIELYVK